MHPEVPVTTRTKKWEALIAKCSREMIQDSAVVDAIPGPPRHVAPELAFRFTLKRGSSGSIDLSEIVGGIPGVVPGTLEPMTSRFQVDRANLERDEEPVAVVFRGTCREDLHVFYSRSKAELSLQHLPDTRESKIVLLPVSNKKPMQSGELPGRTNRIAFSSLPPGSYLLVAFPIIDAEALQQRALQLRDSCHFDEALVLLEEALEAEPNHALAWTRKATTLRRMGRHEEAMAAAEKALHADPECALAWRAKGALLRDGCKHQEGLDCYLRSLQLDPSDHLCWENKGNALMTLGRVEEANDAYAMGEQVKLLHPEERY